MTLVLTPLRLVDDAKAGADQTDTKTPDASAQPDVTVTAPRYYGGLIFGGVLFLLLLLTNKKDKK